MGATVLIAERPFAGCELGRAAIGALLEPQMLGSSEYVEAEWRYERIDDVSHWIPLDASEQLNDLLLDWFQQH